ncbi:MAG: hypothetical protein ACXAEX_15590 [Promethearchaeota archaeon]|jgi:hypothetical protein
MKLLAILGGLGGLYFGFKRIYYMRITFYGMSDLFTQIFSLNGFLGLFTGIVVASLTVLVTVKPNDPLPWHYGILILFGILLFPFNHLLAGIAVLGAGIIGFFKKS